MNYEQVITFIAVYEKKSFVAASNTLCVSPGTVGKRISALEYEFGFTLFERSRGINTVSLTKQGFDFLPIAKEWLAVYEKTEALKTTNETTSITFSSVGAINSLVLGNFFISFINEHSDVKLSIITHYSNETFNKILNRTADIGLVCNKKTVPGLTVSPLFKDKMGLVCKRNDQFGKTVDCRLLDRNNEIYIYLNNDKYSVWHNKHWDPTIKPLISISPSGIPTSYFSHPNSWAVAPLCVINTLIKLDPDLAVYELNDQPPCMYSYLVLRDNDKGPKSEIINSICEELRKYIKNTNLIIAL